MRGVLQYYEALGDLRPLPAGPAWKAPQPSPVREGEMPNERLKRKRVEAVDQHRQDVSRHRDEFERPATPCVFSPSPSLPPFGAFRRELVRLTRLSCAVFLFFARPDYWEIGMYDDDQIQEINRQAREIQDGKRRKLAEEAGYVLLPVASSLYPSALKQLRRLPPDPLTPLLALTERRMGNIGAALE